MDLTYIASASRDAQIAYAAGIINGEGHIGFSWQERKSGVAYPSIRMTITQWYSPEILLAFQMIMDFGTVENNDSSNPNAWRYREQGYENIVRGVEEMWPWLSEPKRFDAEATIFAYKDYLSKKELLRKTCKHGHDQSVYGYINSAGSRSCRECQRKQNKEYRERKKSVGLRSPS
jgi:hypothetical protein